MSEQGPFQSIKPLATRRHTTVYRVTVYPSDATGGSVSNVATKETFGCRGRGDGTAVLQVATEDPRRIYEMIGADNIVHVERLGIVYPGD